MMVQIYIPAMYESSICLYENVVLSHLICICLITNGVGHILGHLFALWINSFVNLLFMILVVFQFIIDFKDSFDIVRI